MSKPRGSRVCTTNPVNREAIRILKSTGQEFEIVDGAKHLKVFLAGKYIGVIAKAGKRGRDTVMLETQIKRRLKELQCQS